MLLVWSQLLGCTVCALFAKTFLVNNLLGRGNRKKKGHVPLSQNMDQNKLNRLAIKDRVYIHIKVLEMFTTHKTVNIDITFHFRCISW